MLDTEAPNSPPSPPGGARRRPPHQAVLTRPTLDGLPAVTLEQLVRTAPRLRHDRLVVGEVRGPNVLGLVQALNTRHDGSSVLCGQRSEATSLTRIRPAREVPLGRAVGARRSGQGESTTRCSGDQSMADGVARRGRYLWRFRVRAPQRVIGAAFRDSPGCSAGGVRCHVGQLVRSMAMVRVLLPSRRTSRPGCGG
jgi:hypothetical protein